MSFAKYMPEHWQEWLATQHGGLVASDFKSMVSVEFEDGSNAFFRYAFVVHDEGRKEFAVFTEHCGYHVFSTRGVIIRQMQMQKMLRINKVEPSEDD